MCVWEISVIVPWGASLVVLGGWPKASGAFVFSCWVVLRRLFWTTRDGCGQDGFRLLNHLDCFECALFTSPLYSGYDLRRNKKKSHPFKKKEIKSRKAWCFVLFLVILHHYVLVAHGKTCVRLGVIDKEYTCFLAPSNVSCGTYGLSNNMPLTKKWKKKNAELLELSSSFNVLDLLLDQHGYKDIY
jgi:hypothetical protein